MNMYCYRAYLSITSGGEDVSKNNDKNQKQPYMYIVQPDISAPVSNMQSQYRSAVDQKGLEVIEVDDDASVVSEDIRVVSTEDLNKQDTVQVENIVERSEDAQEVVEVSTSVDTEIKQEDKNKKSQAKKRVKHRKKQKFSDMTKEELTNFLARMPAAVPKPTCNISIRGEELTGQVQKKKGDIYFIKLIYEDSSEIIGVKLEEIDHIAVENL